MATISDMKIGATSNLRQMSAQLSSLDKFSRTVSMSMGPQLEILDSINRALSVSTSTHMRTVEGLNRAISMSMASQLDYIDRSLSSLNKVLSMSVNSVLTDLQYDVTTVPRYIPARHLGSGPFREDTEQDGTDSLMVIRMSDLHPDVLMTCNTELSNGDYFHAVQEAIKGLLWKIRRLTGLKSDGISLVEQAFAYKNRESPHIAINKLDTPSKLDEQEGFIDSLKGLIRMYRNPLAHEPKVTWILGKDRAVYALLQITDYHSRIDHAFIRRVV